MRNLLCGERGSAGGRQVYIYPREQRRQPAVHSPGFLAPGLRAPHRLSDKAQKHTLPCTAGLECRVSTSESQAADEALGQPGSSWSVAAGAAPGSEGSVRGLPWLCLRGSRGAQGLVLHLCPSLTSAPSTCSFSWPVPKGAGDPSFHRQPGPAQGWGKAALPWAGTLPADTGGSAPGSRRLRGAVPAGKAPFALRSMAESRSPAVLINGRSGTPRGLAAAPGCSELAGAAALLRSVPVPVPVRSQPAGSCAHSCAHSWISWPGWYRGLCSPSSGIQHGMGNRRAPIALREHTSWHGTERRRETRPVSSMASTG